MSQDIAIASMAIPADGIQDKGGYTMSKKVNSLKRAVALTCLVAVILILLTACANEPKFTALDGFYQRLEITTNSHNVIYQEHPYYITNGKIQELLQLDKWEAVKTVKDFEPVMDIPTGESEGVWLTEGVACFYAPGLFQQERVYYNIPQEVVSNVIAYLESMK